MIEIYTDGACSGNPGPGGYGVVVVQDGKVINSASLPANNTTNNREEMKAILWAFGYYGQFNPTVYSDSAYAVNTFTNWMWGWKNRGWVKSDKKTPENLDLVKAYDEICKIHGKLNIQHIKGHAGILYNELADQLATGKITPKEVLEKYG